MDYCFTDKCMSMLPVDCTAVHDFIDYYVFMNYINIDSAKFPPEIKAEFFSSISRTTNVFVKIIMLNLMVYVLS